MIVEIFDLQGRMVYKEEFTSISGNNSDFKIDLSGQQKGIYFLNLKTGKGIIGNSKIIIE